ncbi:MAG: hypothetical protein K2L95_01830 [Alphaproteobacteria bacterium]|nr:hypothetical protein [Alphaproteobacteria bacterium]
MKLIWLGVAAGAVMVTSSVFAMTKCVKLTSSMTCSQVDTPTYQSNWMSDCAGTRIHGVAFCGNQNSNLGDKTDAVGTGLTSDDNRYCWCKMVSPAVSSWVFAFIFGSAGDCSVKCAYYCAHNAATHAVFVAALFSGLGD